MVIDHSCGLHEGKAGCGADKAEPAYFHVPRRGVRLWSGCGYSSGGYVRAAYRSMAGKLPDIAVQATVLLPDF